MSQATPTKFSMLFKHYMANFSENLVTIPSIFPLSMALLDLRILQSIHRYGVIFNFWKKKSKGHCEAMFNVKRIYFIDF